MRRAVFFLKLLCSVCFEFGCGGVSGGPRPSPLVPEGAPLGTGGRTAPSWLAHRARSTSTHRIAESLRGFPGTTARHARRRPSPRRRAHPGTRSRAAGGRPPPPQHPGRASGTSQSRHRQPPQRPAYHGSAASEPVEDTIAGRNHRHPQPAAARPGDVVRHSRKVRHQRPRGVGARTGSPVRQ